MTTKNTRNARLLLCGTLGGTYIPVTKSHGLKGALKTDFSEDTGHGQNFKSKIPGLADYNWTIAAYYDTAYTTLEYAAIHHTAYYALVYFDYADVQNYHQCQVYISFSDVNLDLGNTADQTFEMVLAGADPQIVRNGAVL